MTDDVTPAGGPPNLRDSQACCVCHCSSMSGFVLEDLDDLYCRKHERVVKEHQVCDDYEPKGEDA